jgi:AcrR family transcriptional regulator
VGGVSTGSPIRKRKPHGKGNTVHLLVIAAAKEFEEYGFDGTDSNKIARRAGFAPQTFYRWFSDKTEIFVAVYKAWVLEEYERIDSLREQNAPDSKLIDAVIAHHRAYHIFRRSLRQLSVDDDTVRRARAASRMEQIERLKARYGAAKRNTADVAIFLFQHERLCDAIADGEFEDLGVEEDSVREYLAQLYKQLRSKR